MGEVTTQFCNLAVRRRGPASPLETLEQMRKSHLKLPGSTTSNH